MNEKIYFSDSKGNKICGILSNPIKKYDLPVIILCHGFGNSKESSTNKNLEKIFNKKNIAVFRFDFFGHGESEGKFEDITISRAVDNILNAVKLLKKKGFSRIGLIGSSFGGLSSIIAASKTKDLFVLALKCPVSDFSEVDFIKRTKEELKKWKSEGFISYNKRKKINYSFYEDIKNNNGYKAAKKIKVPVLIVHGDKDKTVSVEQSKKTARILKNSRLKIIKGADHRFSKINDFEEVLKIVSEFVFEIL
jgi:uncharacterized protein